MSLSIQEVLKQGKRFQNSVDQSVVPNLDTLPLGCFDEAGRQRIGLLCENQALVELATLHGVA